MKPAMRKRLNALMGPMLDLMVPGAKRRHELVRTRDAPAFDLRRDMVQLRRGAAHEAPHFGNALHVALFKDGGRLHAAFP